MRVKIHPAAIDLMSRFFNMHRKGLPEWMKNAREVYLRREVPYGERLVVIHYLPAKLGRPAMLECIDFGGITGDDIDSQYMEWANPEAAAGRAKISGVEGGQGNGGKAYLRQMFEKGYFISIESGRLSVVSFLDEKKYELGFVPDVGRGKDNPGDNPELPDFRKYARGWLKALGLPETHNVTVVRGISPTKPIEIDALIDEIQTHPQARQTIKTCRVSLYVDLSFRRDLTVREPEYDPAFACPIVVNIPRQIGSDGVAVLTSEPPKFPQGELRLKISKVPLRGQALQSWNRIDFYGDSVRPIGYKQVPELELVHPEYASYVTGECSVPLLVDPRENYESQGRGPLIDGPLSQALYRFIASEIDKVLEQLAKRNAGVVATKKRKNLEILNETLAQWIEGKLTVLRGLDETGEDTGFGKRKRRTPQPQQHNPLVTIHIHRTALKICVGVGYQLRAFGKDAQGKIVPSGKLTWTSSDSKVVQIDPDAGRVIAKRLGLASIVATSKGGMTTPQLMVQVVEAKKIDIKSQPPARVGSNRRLPLLVYVTNQNDRIEKDAIVAWRTSDASVVSMGQDGVLVGGEVGDATVVAYAGGVESDALGVIVDKGAGGKPKGGGHGRPHFLLSGQHSDPFDGGAPVILQSTDPAVYQRPYKPDYENNVFWINLQHPLAAALLDYGENSVQWRTYHFQRIVDSYTIIELRSRFEDSETLDVDQVLTEVHEIMAKLYRDAKDEIYSILYAEDLDIASLQV